MFSSPPVHYEDYLRMKFEVDENEHLVEIECIMLFQHDRDRFDRWVNAIKTRFDRSHQSFHCNHLIKRNKYQSMRNQNAKTVCTDMRGDFQETFAYRVSHVSTSHEV